MLIATLFMAIMYLTMTLGISELSTMLPYAGGPYSFARRAMGRYIGFITGVGVVLQYVIAAPIIAIGIGAISAFCFQPYRQWWQLPLCMRCSWGSYYWH